MGKLSTMQRIAVGYACALAFAAALNYIPGFTDAQGRTFGIFALDLYDDLLHLASAAWALLAAWTSRAAAVTFLKTFGALYFLDGLLGVLTGVGFLDLGIFIYGPQPGSMVFKFLASAPHLVLGGFAMYAGFKRRAPRWMQNAGLEWLFRFIQEPRRLFRRYFVRDAAFIGIVARALWARRGEAVGGEKEVPR